ncbi:hypothetical protein [Duganella sp. BuS-21]|uniref:hypothetical protein n=1 Tax=Duganella sp. BuS-21 TaxID=2943848 RepID=UPI0035A6905D
MAVVKKKLGAIPCPCCGHPVMVRENDAGTLTISCDGCDISAFAKKGTDAAAKWRKALPVTVPKEEFQKPAEEAPAATPPAQIAPPKAKAAGVFDFLGKGA